MRSKLLSAAALVLMTLLLHGAETTLRAAIVLIMFAAYRLTLLCAEWAGPDPSSGPRARAPGEILAEAAGAAAYVLFLPAALLVFTREYISIGERLEPVEVAAAAGAATLYFLPHWLHRVFRLPSLKILWWTAPLGPLMVATLLGVLIRHPYINPFEPQRERLAAEKVCGLKDNVQAARDAGAILTWARTLERQNRPAEAALYYEIALRLRPRDETARARLAALQGHGAGSAERDPSSDNPEGSSWHFIDPFAPYDWERGEPPPLPLCSIDASLARLNSLTIILYPVGEVPHPLLAAIGATLRSELNIPALQYRKALPLPPPTRFRGLANGPQRSVESICGVFRQPVMHFVSAPVRHLAVTPADIYGGDANYVFSASFPWGAVLSYARYLDPNFKATAHNASKQALCAIIKSFGIPPSTDPTCVTSYTQSLIEFETKGNRPNAETLQSFRLAVARFNREWEEFRAHHQSPPTP